MAMYLSFNRSGPGQTLWDKRYPSLSLLLIGSIARLRLRSLLLVLGLREASFFLVECGLRMCPMAVIDFLFFVFLGNNASIVSEESSITRHYCCRLLG